jgi:hypothetical protein
VSLGNVVPEGGFAGSEKRVFSGVPAQEVRGFCVRGVMLASFPDFVKKKLPGLIGGAMQVVLQAAFFFPRRADESAEFRFQQKMLALFGTQGDDKSHRAFGKFADLGFGGFAFAGMAGRLFGFAL